MRMPDLNRGEGEGAEETDKLKASSSFWASTSCVFSAIPSDLRSLKKKSTAVGIPHY